MNNTREQNIDLISNLFGLDKEMLLETIGFKSYNYDDYTDEELSRFAKISQDYDNELTKIFCNKN